MGDAVPVLRVLLVGFMASGKTGVARVLARRLGWQFFDFDDVIVKRVGQPIREIFSVQGEPAFREIETEVGNELLAREHVVLASGGGWAAVPGRLQQLDAATLSVWLRVSAETAVTRTRYTARSRPLLDVEDPVAQARRLLAEREPFYRVANLTLDTDHASFSDLADRILAVVRQREQLAISK